MSADRRPSCAVFGNGSSGVPRVSGGWPNRFEHEVGFAAARVRFAIGHDGPDEVGIDRVSESANALRAGVRQREHRAPRVIRKTEREHLAQSYVSSPQSAGKRHIETDLEWLPRPRQWSHRLTTSPGKMRSFITGNDKRTYASDSHNCWGQEKGAAKNELVFGAAQRVRGGAIVRRWR